MSILEGMTKALAILAAHEATPSSIELTRDNFEKLKAECHFPTGREVPNNFMGVRITIKEDS